MYNIWLASDIEHDSAVYHSIHLQLLLPPDSPRRQQHYHSHYLMTWTIDLSNPNRNFKIGDIVRAISDPHKDRILIVLRVDHPTIYLEAASGTSIPTFSKTYQDLRHTTQLIPPAATFIYSAIELTSSSSDDSTNDNSSDSDSDCFTPPVLINRQQPSALALLQWSVNWFLPLTIDYRISIPR